MKKFTILLLLFVISNAFSQKKLFDYPIGMQAYTMRNHWDKGVDKVLDTLQKIGITELEAGIPKGYTAEQYLETLAKYNMKLTSSGLGFQMFQNEPEKALQIAKSLKVKYFMCSWIPHKGNDFTIDDAKKAVDVFNKAGKLFKENGIYFCYHAHGYEFRPSTVSKGTMMDYIIENTNHKYVFFELDVLWIMHGGGADMPQKLLKKYPGRWKLMHIKDLRKGAVGNFTGQSPAFDDVIIGTGQANWKKIFKLARKAGIEHCYLEDESNKELEHMPLSIEYLKSLR